MKRYQWKPGSRFSVAAEVAGQALEELRAANGERLEPQNVVEASRPEDSPLHPCFTWDDEAAAEAYRRVEARQLIHSLYVIEQRDPDLPARPEVAYVHVTDPENGPCYMTAARVLSDDDLRDLALAEALGMLHGFRRRFEHLSELAEVFKAIAQVEAARTTKPKRAARTAGRR